MKYYSENPLLQTYGAIIGPHSYNLPYDQNNFAQAPTFSAFSVYGYCENMFMISFRLESFSRHIYINFKLIIAQISVG